MRGALAAKTPTRTRPDSPFERAVARVVRRIPRGTTLGYGEVAERAGKPGAARLVARALNRLEGLPWWRVARHDGTLAPTVAFEQAQLLRAERWPGPPAARRVAGARGSRSGSVAGPARGDDGSTGLPSHGGRRPAGLRRGRG